jgi:hypothetical protein
MMGGPGARDVQAGLSDRIIYRVNRSIGKLFAAFQHMLWRAERL